MIQVLQAQAEFIYNFSAQLTACLRDLAHQFKTETTRDNSVLFWDTFKNSVSSSQLILCQLT
jgi:hypothetical protein